MPEIGYASMAVIPTFKGLQSDLERGSSKAMSAAGSRGGDKFGRSAAGAAKSRFAGAAKSIVGPLVGAFAAVKVGSFLKDSVAEARESQKVGALTNSTIKATGKAAGVTAKQVGALSTSISNKTGIDDETIQRGANMILTFKKVRNTVGKGNHIFDRATQTVTDMAAAMAGGSGGDIDLKSASIQIGKALNDPVKGMTALGKVGVTFTDKQKAVNKALVEGGILNALAAKGVKVTATQFAKIQKDNKFTYQQTVDYLTGPMTKAQQGFFDHLQEGGHTVEAQKNVLKELNSEFGGAAASQSTAGEKVKVAFDNIKESVGTALLPAIDDVENAFLKKGVPALQTFVDWAENKGVPAIKDFGKKAAPVVRNVLGKARDFLKEATPYAEKFVKAFNKLPNSVKTGVAAGGVLAFGATKLPGGKKGVGALGGGAKALVQMALPKKPIPVIVVNKGFGDGVGTGSGKPKAPTVGPSGLPPILAKAPYLVAAAGVNAETRDPFHPRKAPKIPFTDIKLPGGDEPTAPKQIPDSKLNMKQLQSLYSDVLKNGTGDGLKADASRLRELQGLMDGLKNKSSTFANGFDTAKVKAQHLNNEVKLIGTNARGSRGEVRLLLAALDKAQQSAVRVQQGVSAARTDKVGAQLGHGGMNVERMYVSGTSLSEVRRDAGHQQRAKAHGAESFK